jgi:hypothetical protein
MLGGLYHVPRVSMQHGIHGSIEIREQLDAGIVKAVELQVPVCDPVVIVARGTKGRKEQHGRRLHCRDNGRDGAYLLKSPCTMGQRSRSNFPYGMQTLQ